MNALDTAPTFSVIIPTHNRAELMPRAVESVLAQTYDDFELLVVDDASTDDTEDVMASFEDERVVYVRREENAGHAAARNTGIQRARGEYVAFLDDDDEYLPRFLEEMHRAFECGGEDAGFGWCGTRRVRDTPDGQEHLRDELWRPSYASQQEAYLSFLRARSIGTNCGLTVRRSCFEEVGLFDDSLRVTVDTEFLVRIVRQFGFVVAPAVLVKYHVHEGVRQSRRLAEKARTYERIAEKHRDTLSAHDDVAAAVYYKTGWLHYHSGHREQGRRFMRKALARKPFKLKALVGLLMFELLGRLGAPLHEHVSNWVTRVNRFMVESSRKSLGS